MPTTGELCVRTVYVADRQESLRDVARRMRDRHVGALVVIEERGGERYPVGMITDRDIVVGAVARDAEVGTLSVGGMLHRPVVTAVDTEDLTDAVRRMQAYGVRRLPVVDSRGVLQGLLTYDDLVAFFAEQTGNLAALLGHEVAREQDTRPPLPRPGM